MKAATVLLTIMMFLNGMFLCLSLAGIRCKKLSGFSKGASYKPGKVFKGDSDHAWNAVYLDGGWHLLDSTWGSGFVENSCTKFTFRYVSVGIKLMNTTVGPSIVTSQWVFLGCV